MGEYHAHATGPTVVTDETGPNVLMAIIAVAVIGALIWLFAFSGVVFDRNDGTPPRVTNNEFNNNQAPPAQPAPEEPAPAQS